MAMQGEYLGGFESGPLPDDGWPLPHRRPGPDYPWQLVGEWSTPEQRDPARFIIGLPEGDRLSITLTVEPGAVRVTSGAVHAVWLVPGPWAVIHWLHVQDRAGVVLYSLGPLPRPPRPEGGEPPVGGAA